MGFWNDFVGWARSRPAPALPAPISRFGDARRMDGASISNPFTGLGGSWDKGAASRPNPMVMPLSDQELEALHANNGIARKLVEIFPQRATREGWTVADVPQSEEKRLKIRANVREGMTWGQLYGGSVVLLVTEDDVPPQFADRPQEWLKQPLVLPRIGRLHALQVFDARSASPQDWDRDVRSPNYRLPRTWSITDDDFSAEVHHTRVAFFRGARRPPGLRRAAFGRTWSNLPDQSYLQHLWDNIRAFCETMNGGAALAAELTHAVMKIGDLHTAMTGSQAEVFKERMKLSQLSLSQLGMMLLGKDDEYEKRSTPPSGFGELSEAAKAVLSAVSGIPQQELWGDTPSGLNTDGSSGKEGFRATISDFQESHREPIERIYQVLLCSQDGPTMGMEPPEWELKFRPLDEPSELTQAQLRQIVAQTDAELIDSGLMSADHIRRHRYGADGFKFEIPGLDEQELQELEVEDQARKQLQELQTMQGMMPQDGEEGGDGEPGTVPPGPGAPSPAPPRGADPSDLQALA